MYLSGLRYVGRACVTNNYGRYEVVYYWEPIGKWPRRESIADVTDNVT